MRKLTLFFILIFSLQILAQNKAVALKFDEFDDSSDDYLYSEPLSISQRIDRFAKQAKKQPNANAYIIYYQPRITTNYNNEGENLANTIKSILEYYKGVNYQNIILIDGGIRETKAIEFWLAPKNAEPPKPVPHFDKSELVLCPQISVYGNGFNYNRTKTLGFSVSISNVAENTHFDYEWKVSAGNIISGQGTKKISVDVSKSDAKTVMAFVKVKGVDILCKDSDWNTLEINSNNAIQIDRAQNYNESQMKSMLDGIFLALNSDPTAKGYIIIYANRNKGAKEMERGIKSIKSAMFFRRLDESRVEIVKGGYRDENTIDMWILPPGATPPKSTPTVDKKFVEIPVKKKAKRK